MTAVETPPPAPIDSSDGANESTLRRMGVRAALVLMLVATACIIAIAAAWQALSTGSAPSVIAPVHDLCLLAVGYYFGQKTPASKPPNS